MEHEVSHVIDNFLDSFITQHHPHPYVRNTLERISQCRTAALGGHVDQCDQCGHEHISYNSCRNRHCPKCQGRQREQWISSIKEMLLPVGHFHVVFTLPQSLNPLFLSHQAMMQDTLFEAAWKTLTQFACDPTYLGAKTGMVAVLHTWGQTLGLHPHLHCIVPEGGITIQGDWKQLPHATRDTPYLFPVKQMGHVFRGIFLRLMSRKLKKIAIKPPTVKENVFNVFAKRPFRSVNTVVEYLGRYTHKVAISNNRIQHINEDGVTFRYKDYRDNQKKQMRLAGEEFLRRFTLHIQPKGFHRIRRFGIYSPSNRSKLQQIKLKMGKKAKPILESIKEEDPRKEMREPTQCPCCKTGRLRLFRIIERPRAPPKTSVHSASIAV